MIDYKDFSHQLDGLWSEILPQYGIEIPRMRGINSDNYPCPLCGGDDRAHWRDVNGRLCLFCRHCAADSMHPPENVIMEYAGISFGDMVKDLADFINHVPIERVKVAQKRVYAPKFNLPPDDKRDEKKAAKFKSLCSIRDLLGCEFWEKDGDQFLPIKTFADVLVNAAWIGKDIKFIAGGVSYGAYTLIKKQNNDDYYAVSDCWNARKIAELTGENVLIAWSSYNIKYLVKHAPSNMKITPVLTADDSGCDNLCYDMDWVFYDEKNNEIKHKKMGEEL